ncbi:hypothetical protein ACET3X_002896 [Alternaria dauci]|uniref:BTB domain-containing protein n=1 Tax=Alternaria dauci TaxID=48095 RepID=A0ABR3UT67_9PLEO
MASLSEPKDISLFNDPTLSDVKIRQVYKGQTKEYFAHKAILCAHSKWFLKAFTGNFKEASEHTIEVHDDDPQSFEYLLKFLYTMEIVIVPEDIVAGVTKDIDQDILAPTSLYILADKYEIAPLLRRTVGMVAAALITHRKSLGAENTKTIVTAYYTHCLRAQSSMGSAIAFGLVYYTCWILRGDIDKISALVTAHCPFAADLVIARRRPDL